MARILQCSAENMLWFLKNKNCSCSDHNLQMAKFKICRLCSCAMMILSAFKRWRCTTLSQYRSFPFQNIILILPVNFREWNLKHLNLLFHLFPGSRGVFCELRQSDRRMLDFYTKLGCFKPIKMAGLPEDVVAMGASLWTRSIVMDFSQVWNVLRCCDTTVGSNLELF